MAQSRTATIVLTARDLASKKVSGLGSTLKVLGGIAAAVGAYQIGTKLVQGMEHAVELAGLQQSAEKGVAQALIQRGESVSKLLPELKKQAAAMQTLTGIGDEQILENQRLLLTTGQLATDKLPQATKAALDLAAATGVEGRVAFDLIAKAATGYTSTLSRYGIILSESIPKAEKFDAALAQIDKKFGGQAAAQLDTYAGRVGALQARWGDLLEKFGDLIVKSPSVNKLLEGTATIVADLTESFGDASKGTDIFRGLSIVLVNVGIALAKIAVAAQDLIDTGVIGKTRSIAHEAAEGVKAQVSQVKVGISQAREEIAKLLPGFGGLVGQVGAWAVAGKDAADAQVGGFHRVKSASEKVLDDLIKLKASLLDIGDEPPLAESIIGDTATLAEFKDKATDLIIAPWIRGAEVAKDSIALTRQLVSEDAAARLQIEGDAAGRVLDLRIDAARDGSAELYQLERQRLDRFYRAEVDSANAIGADTTAIFQAWALQRGQIDRDQAAATQDALAFNAAQALDGIRQQAQTLTETVLEAVQTLSRGISTALGDVIIRGKDAGEAIKQTFESIAQSVLDLLVNQAVQYVATAILGASASATQHIARMGQLASETYAAAFAATAAIPFIGPALAPGVAATSVASMLAASAGAYAAGTAAGGAQGALPAFLRGGIVEGPGGPDRTTIRATAGETVLDTSPGEGRAILSGRAKVVPANDRDSGSRIYLTVNAADSRSIYQLLERDPDSFVRLTRKIGRLGLFNG